MKQFKFSDVDYTSVLLILSIVAYVAFPLQRLLIVLGIVSIVHVCHVLASYNRARKALHEAQAIIKEHLDSVQEITDNADNEMNIRIRTFAQGFNTFVEQFNSAMSYGTPSVGNVTPEMLGASVDGEKVRRNKNRTTDSQNEA